MLEVLSLVFNVLTAWCPRFTKVPPTFRLVKWSRCKEATLHGPGCIWFWPLFTEKEDVDIRWKSTVTHVQSITMADGTTVSARTLTVWKPDDILVAVCENEDYGDRVAESGQSVLVDVLGAMHKEQLKQVGVLNATLTLSVQQELRDLGIEVQKCKFTELCISPAFRIINDG